MAFYWTQQGVVNFPIVTWVVNFLNNAYYWTQPSCYGLTAGCEHARSHHMWPCALSDFQVVIRVRASLDSKKFAENSSH